LGDREQPNSSSRKNEHERPRRCHKNIPNAWLISKSSLPPPPPFLPWFVGAGWGV
jgi:hypothetical protein